MAHSSITRPRNQTTLPVRNAVYEENMTRSPSAEPNKPSKRKGTRSVSTLTPSQLARKRANDREAQRAIRQRTKEHIDSLERELDELKRQQSRDETVQGLMRRNRELERELMIMREEFHKIGGVTPSSHSYPSPVYEDNISASASGLSSSRASSAFGQHSAVTNDYPSPVAGYGDAAGYIPTSEPCDSSWASVVPCSVPSTVSSPTSTTNDEYGYMPTTVAPLLESARLPPTSVPVIENQEIDYDEGERDAAYGRAHPASHHHGLPTNYHHHMHHQHPQQQQHHQHQQSWNAAVYSVPPVYYSQSPGL